MLDPGALEEGPVSAWLAAVLQEERRGELLAACDLASRGAERHPESRELAFRSVLALGRSGATTEAERRFLELGLENVEDSEVASLWARLQKDRALSTTGHERRRLAAIAATSYQKVADQGGGYFPAINAATMSLVAGNARESEERAAIALAMVEKSGDLAYYGAATRAEALLLLGDLHGARAELARAAQLHHGDFGAVSTTRRQLELICATRGLDDGWLTELAGPTVAHFCGHLVLSTEGGRRRSLDEDRASGQMADAIASRSVAIGYGSLAAGGDILWAESLLAAGGELHVVLPFVIEDFIAASVKPSGSEWIDRFQRCLEAATRVSYTTEDRYLGDDSLFGYCARVAMGLALLRSRYLAGDAVQLALWDGEPPNGDVGAASDVDVWRRTGHDAVIVTPVGPKAPKASTNARRQLAGASPTRVIRALLVGDMQGYSRLSDQQVIAFSEHVMGAMARVLSRYGHTVEYRNTWGDAVIAVMTSASAAAGCGLEMLQAMDELDRSSVGLPDDLALRLSGHIGPVFPFVDPIVGVPSFIGSHISRTARIEPVTPPSTMYVTEEFAAALEVDGGAAFHCDYVGHMQAAKNYGRLRMYHLSGRRASQPS
jgi:hypothetical protein